MRRMRYLMAAIAGLWLSTAAAAEGAGICFQAESHNLAVVKKYSKPSRGSCKSFAGWEGVLGGSHPVYGTACLNSAGDTLRVGYTIADGGSFGKPIFVSMSLPYPSLANGQATTKTEGDPGVFISDALAGDCFQFFYSMP